jgi:hypothetical protein
VKVWDKRTFKDLDDDGEIGARNMRLALRRLRRFARTGAAEELDLDGTIRESARQGYIDVKLRPERRNAVKVLLFLDVGTSSRPRRCSRRRARSSSTSHITTSTTAPTRRSGPRTGGATRRRRRCLT